MFPGWIYATYVLIFAYAKIRFAIKAISEPNVCICLGGKACDTRNTQYTRDTKRRGRRRVIRA